MALRLRTRSAALATGAALVVSLLAWQADDARAATCAPATTQRLTRPPAAGGNRVVFVYIVPTGARDDRLDLPTVCTDGRINASPLARTYRNISVWMAKELAARGGSLRFVSPSRTYRNPYTGATAGRTAVYFARSPISAATWDCWSSTKKLEETRRLLRERGFTHLTDIYVGIVQSKQTCASLGTAGAGWVSAAGSTFAVAYIARFVYAGSGRYLPARFGCANYSVDAVVAHEIFHVLGAVPLGSPSADGAGHITSAEDLMKPVLPGPFASSTGGTRLDLDHGTNDYRLLVTRQPWLTKGISPSTTYRLC